MAYKRLIIVKQKHINAGMRRVCFACPVALAIKDAYNVPVALVKDAWLSYKSNDRPSTAYITSKSPRSVVRFFTRFDKGLPVKPFKFWFKPYLA